MKRKYFISFEFYTGDISKFWWGVVRLNLNKVNITEWCQQIMQIKHGFTDNQVAASDVKITSLNRV